MHRHVGKPLGGLTTRVCSQAIITVLAATQAFPAVTIDLYRLVDPQGAPVEQASDLHYGAFAGRRGLWVPCDRNGGASAGIVYFISAARLAHLQGSLVQADEAFSVALPAEPWEQFAARYAAAGADLLQDLHSRIADRQQERRLDLEAITVGPAVDGRGERLFAVAEEPYSAILELAFDPASPGLLTLTGVYRYPEEAAEHGTDCNDGLEGFAWAGQPGLFYFAEEGTCLHAADAHPRLFFSNPRIGVCRLAKGRLEIQQPQSRTMTGSLRRLRRGTMQTLNGLAASRTGPLLTLDRNGARLLSIDAGSGQASDWLDLRAIGEHDLVAMMAEFPGPRRMPYISIEGLAMDDTQSLWLVDDPAMPESFRNSCLVRIRGLGLPASGGPATQTSSSRPSQADK